MSSPASAAPLDIDRLLSRRGSFETSYSDREVMLYALGIGLGRDPLDEGELRFVTEKSLLVMPSFATIPGFSQRLLTDADGLDRVKLVHGEQRLELHQPLPAAATLAGEVRIADILDKGEGKGLIVIQEILLRLEDSGERLATVTGTGFYRGDGGRGGTGASAPPPHPLPDRAPDRTVEIATRPDQALLYRLSGDRNPLHSDPAFARAAGFERPILHGLCSYGIACRAVVQSYCADAPERVRRFDVRFSAPVFPGETIVTEMWRDGGVISYRSRVKERDTIVLNNGRCELG